MDAPVTAGVEAQGGPFDALRAEAQASVAQAANAIRRIRERYRAAFADELERWHELRDDVEAAERPETSVDGLRLASLRSGLDGLGADRIAHQAELARIELALRHLESTWLFLERGDASLVSEAGGPAPDTGLQMRLVQAQEAERARLAQEIHDGPAQALSNAIFQVEFVERTLEREPETVPGELRYLRDLLRRELDEVRAFISHLRPRVLDELGLDGALRESVAQASLRGLMATAELAAPPSALPDVAQPVVLRVAQEALHNVRKHAAASSVTVATRLENDAWVLEVADDGRGFDVDAAGGRNRRNFGLQFMRERALLIGASFEVRSRPEGGTVVRLTVPVGAERST